MRCAAFVACAALGALACRGGRDGGAHAADAAVVRLGRENVAVVQRTELKTGPNLSGTLEARRSADVRSELSGSVLEVKAELGQAVRRGQLLARLEDQDLRQAAASAEAQVGSARQALEVARREERRSEVLVRGGALARRDLEARQNDVTAARARVNEAEAGLAAARAKLDNAMVRAPLDGLVSQRAVSAGDVVSPGTLLFSIIDPASIRLEATVPSAAAGVLAVGLPVEFKVRGYGSRVFLGRIERVGPAADPQTREVPILVELPNPGHLLLAGLFADGRVLAASRRTTVAPAAAVDTTGDVAMVTRVKNGVVERVSVSLGMRDEATERVEITSGIDPGDVVLVRGAENLTPGTPVALPVGDGGPP